MKKGIIPMNNVSANNYMQQQSDSDVQAVAAGPQYNCTYIGSNGKKQGMTENSPSQSSLII